MCLNQGHAQDTTLQSIGGILDSYFIAASIEDSASRYAAYQGLFTESASISAVVMNRDAMNKISHGSWKDYLQNSMSYYNQFTPSFTEESRETEYYLELATVHCTVNQTSRKRSSEKLYEERYWMQFDLIYLNERWYIDNLLWVNEVSGLLIEEALVTDTLLYRPN